MFQRFLVVILFVFIATRAYADIFQVEDYIAFADSTAENLGGEYRSDAVDIESTSDIGGGYNIGWTENGEWLVLGNLPITETGTYVIHARVASETGGSFSLDLNGGSIQLGQIDVPVTGGWQNWQTQTMQVVLEPGNFDLGLFVVTGGFNVNWIEVIPLNTPSPTPTPTPTPTLTPTTTPQPVIKIEAEDYTSFFDLTPENIGGAYRTDAVDIESTTDIGGGFNVGWIDPGESLSYDAISILNSDNYIVSLRVASPAGAAASLDLNSNSIPLGQIDIPSTGGWQDWQTVEFSTYINAGNYALDVFAVSAGWNLNWIEISAEDGVTPTPTVTPSPTPTASPSPTPTVTPNPGLVWSDEFNTIDTSVWNFETGGGGWGNVELQYYTNGTNAAIQFDPQAGSNVLVIEARKETGGECWNGGNCEFTSSRINTRYNQSFQYGRVEARLKIPRAQGVWPAFWMLGNSFNDVGWPQGGEIDIMEHAGANDISFCALHGPGYSGGTPFKGDLVLNSDISSQYHIYAVEWDANSISCWVDDIKFYTATKQQVEQYGEWVYDQPFWILLNIAVGGTFGGTPDYDNFTTQRMYVDYVRVYQ